MDWSRRSESRSMHRRLNSPSGVLTGALHLESPCGNQEVDGREFGFLEAREA